jgi:hypothetical protein
MKHYAMLFSGVLACAVAACSGDRLTAHGTPGDLNGSWGEDFGSQVVPGMSFVTALNESGGTVTGTGSYAGEAGPFGALDVSGSAAGDGVHLRFIYVPDPATFPQLKRDTVQFDGVLTTRDHIDGTATRAGITSPFALMRLHVGDPQ